MTNWITEAKALAERWRRAPQDPEEPILAMAADELDALIARWRTEYAPVGWVSNTGLRRLKADGRRQTHISNKQTDTYEYPLYTSPIAHRDGYVYVPRDPTEAMLRAAADPLKVGAYPRNSSVYKAMIAAAPEPEGRE